MKLRTKFILFIIVLHVILILLSFQLLKDYKIYFVVSEFFILISLGISIKLYQDFISPLNLISSGIESLKGQDFSTKFVKVGQFELDQLIDMYNHMINQLREERITQQEQHYFLDRLIQASPSGIIILDLDENITLINPAAQSLVSCDIKDITGKKLDDIGSTITNELCHLESDESKIININGIQAYKCQKSHFIDRGFSHHFILIEELTEQILQTEKKAYDKVIRMMSHEINNSIGAINSILNSSLNYKNQLKEKDQNDFENALSVSIERNNKLNKFMSNFADVVRTPPPTKEIYDLHKLLKNVYTIMSAECEKYNISLKWELVKEQFWVKIDVQQMEQVLLNIIKNSIEAIKSDGQIIIKTTNKPNPSLSIFDSGNGIPKDIGQKLFTPFFSTKQNGQGIGLTLIKEILINHGFRFSLTSTADNLTEFKIDFLK